MLLTLPVVKVISAATYRRHLVLPTVFRIMRRFADIVERGTVGNSLAGPNLRSIVLVPWKSGDGHPCKQQD